ncbi:MAG: metalloregulator ArsR/SmtB family transcription factor [Elusimicrobiota bacterium]|nr:metalloregulator ArsR/SmtB family transcription factor [Elusimicrobiota bacterium]
MNIQQIGNIFAALSQESRLKVFKLLVDYGARGLCAGDISRELKIPKNTLSFHLTLLSQAGLLEKRKEGLYLFYSVNLDAVRDIIDFLLVDCCNSGGSCARCDIFRELQNKHLKRK